MIIFISDMALFILFNHGSSLSIRFYILALIVLVLACFCSHCSSSPLVASVIDDLDESNMDDDFSALQLSSRHYAYDPEQAILSSKNNFLHHLLKSVVPQPEYRHQKYNKRYPTQSFHAMRG
jgi:hypothetical protein